MLSLSIIIASFNTKDITLNCLANLKNNFKKYPLNYEIIVVDNGSTDGSAKMLLDFKKDWPNLKVELLKKNLGYGKANNLGVSKSHGKYILYLNSDLMIDDLDLTDLVSILDKNKDFGALTVKVKLPTGEIDPASHRGFPNLWRSMTYFSGLEKFFKNVPLLNQLFGGYHLVHLNLYEVHEIDSPTGAFFFTRREIINKIGGFDKDYFAYGEDLEMAYQIKSLGYKIIYYPLWSVLHIKSQSGLKKNDKPVRKKISYHFFDSMKIFYRKHYEKKNLWIVNKLVYLAIDLKRRLSK